MQRQEINIPLPCSCKVGEKWLYSRTYSRITRKQPARLGLLLSIYSRSPMPHSPTHARPRSLGLLFSCGYGHSTSNCQIQSRFICKHVMQRQEINIPLPCSCKVGEKWLYSRTYSGITRKQPARLGLILSIYSRSPMPHSPTHARPRSLGLLCSCGYGHSTMHPKNYAALHSLLNFCFGYSVCVGYRSRNLPYHWGTLHWRRIVPVCANQPRMLWVNG